MCQNDSNIFGAFSNQHFSKKCKINILSANVIFIFRNFNPLPSPQNVIQNEVTFLQFLRVEDAIENFIVSFTSSYSTDVKANEKCFLEMSMIEQ